MNSLPLGSRVVEKMVQVVQGQSDTSKYVLYFDNFFSSYDLIATLSERNIAAVGTIRENRTAGASKKKDFCSRILQETTRVL